MKNTLSRSKFKKKERREMTLKKKKRELELKRKEEVSVLDEIKKLKKWTS